MIPGAAELIVAAWRLYRATSSRVAGYLAWLLLPELALVLIGFLPPGPLATAAMVAVIVTSLVLTLWITLIVIRIFSATVRGEPMDLAIGSAGTVFSPFILTGIFQGLAVLVGFILFIIPGLIASVWYSFAPLIAGLDGRRGADALAASRALSKGRFWSVAWRLFAGPLVFTGWYAIIISFIFIPLIFITGVSLETLGGDHPPMWFDIIDSLGQIFLLTPLLLAYTVLLYHALVGEKVVE